MMAGEPGRKPDDGRTAFRLNPDGTWTEPGWCPSRERCFFHNRRFFYRETSSEAIFRASRSVAT